MVPMKVLFYCLHKNLNKSNVNRSLHISRNTIFKNLNIWNIRMVLSKNFIILHYVFSWKGNIKCTSIIKLYFLKLELKKKSRIQLNENLCISNWKNTWKGKMKQNIPKYPNCSVPSDILLYSLVTAWFFVLLFPISLFLSEFSIFHFFIICIDFY